MVFFLGVKELPAFVTNKRHLEECFVHPTDLKKMIGKGSYGKTYAACSQTQCNFVVKVVPLKTAEEKRDFEIEASIAKFAGEKKFGPKVHESVICVTSKQLGLLVMDRMDGDLFQVVETITVDDGLSIAKAVKRMHDHGIWHSDLHRANIMFKNTGHEKLQSGKRQFYVIDFGMAWPLGQKVPAVLRWTDMLLWMAGYRGLKNGRVIGEAPVSANVFRPIYEWTMKQYPNSLNDVKIAYVWRIFDSDQDIKTSEWGPMRSKDMYAFARKLITPAMMKDVGEQYYLDHQAYISFDYSQQQS